MKAAQLGLTLPKRANWGQVKDALEAVKGDVLEKFDGWAFASLARILANAFKHGDGFVPPGEDADLKKWATATDGDVLEWATHVNVRDGKVDFGSLALEPLLDGTEKFLRALDEAL